MTENIICVVVTFGLLWLCYIKITSLLDSYKKDEIEYLREQLKEAKKSRDYWYEAYSEVMEVVHKNKEEKKW